MEFFYLFHETVAQSRNFVVVREFAEHCVDFPVFFKELNRQIAGREVHVQLSLAFQSLLNQLDRLFYVLAEADMHVPHNFVAAFVDLNHRIEQLFDAASVLGDSGHHRHTNHPGQRLVVEHHFASLQFVVHVQGDDHAPVHIDEFCGQIQVPFQIGSVSYVDDDIRNFVVEISPHVEFFGRIGREGIGAGKVDNVKRVTFIFHSSCFGVYGHSAVVAYVLFCAGGIVEE